MTTPPPTYNSLSDIYGDATGEQEKRYASIAEAFEKKYGSAPEFYVRAPGRVNLIGEHVDYCGYGVLPMAIANDMVMAVRTTDGGRLRVAHCGGDDAYPPADEEASKSVPIDKEKSLWTNYFLAGFRGAAETCDLAKPKGMDVICQGTIPQGGGLSSSSAFVCCSAVATLTANKTELPRDQIATACARCERYVGTEGGGMDQAISMMAELGTAKQIDFNPLKATDVKLPDGCSFVVANSLTPAFKQQNAATGYNMRVVECRLGAMILAKKLNAGDWKSMKTLGIAQKAAGLSISEMKEKVSTLLHDEAYTKDEVAKILESTVDEVGEIVAIPGAYGAAEKLEIKLRALHVFSESERVYQFRDLCASGKASLEKLGELMNDSHVSCVELDTLSALARESGALGSRLTGAGWGGCTVSLVPSAKVDGFLSTLKSKYYASHNLSDEQLASTVFASPPMGGAAVYMPKK